MAYRIQLRRDSALDWGNSNPILAEGEMGLIIDSKPYEFKIGDGVSDWKTLPLIKSSSQNEVDLIQEELNRIKSKLDQDIFTGRFKGDISNIIPSNKAYKGYFISTYALSTNRQTIILPNHTDIQDGAIFSIDNQDINDGVIIHAPNGQLIDDSANSINVPRENLLFLIKSGSGWKTGFSGYIPSSLSRLMSDINLVIPTTGSGLTISQIEAQLKDRLHTFGEVQIEFSNQLHTFEEIQEYGFENASIYYGFLDSNQHQPIDSDNWEVGKMLIDKDLHLQAPLKGDKYMGLIVPISIAPIINEIEVQGTTKSFKMYDYVRKGLNYKLILLDDIINTNAIIDVKIELNITESSNTKNDETFFYDSTSTSIDIPLDNDNVFVNYTPNGGDIIQAIPSVHKFNKNGTKLFLRNYSDTYNITLKAPNYQSIDELSNYILEPRQNVELMIDKANRKIQAVSLTNNDLRIDYLSWVMYGWEDSLIQPIDDSWIEGQFPATKSVTIPRTELGDVYLLALVPIEISSLIKEFLVDGSGVDTIKSNYDYKGHKYKLFTSKKTINMSKTHDFTIDWEVQTNAHYPSGMVFDDGSNNIYAGITDVTVNGMLLEPNVNDNTKLNIISVLDIDSYGSSEEGTSYGFKGNSVTLMPPLQSFSDPNIQYGGVIEINKNAYERQHNSGYLSYLSQEVEILGKEYDSNKFHKGVIFPDNVTINSDGIGIKVDKTLKTFGIQEYDGKDPNVTGGSDFLISARVNLKGSSESDGFIRLMLIKTSYNNQITDDYYLRDVNNNIISSENFYKKDDELGFLDLNAVINAKELKEFKMIVISSLNQSIYTKNKMDGLTGIMIQSLTSTEKSGMALTQYELDTKQDINFTTLYLGAERRSLRYRLSSNFPIKTINGGTSANDFNHFGLYGIQNVRYGIINNALAIEGRDFNFHAIFDANETRLMHNRQIKVTLNMQNTQTSYVLALMKWTGLPNDYTSKIHSGRNQASPIFENNWVKIDEQIINVDSSLDYHTVIKEFTIPEMTQNYAVCIYPEIGTEDGSLHLKDFEIDVVNPFNGYLLTQSNQNNEVHLSIDEEYKTLKQNTQGYHSLRYLNTDNEISVPCGVPMSGKADVTVDSTVNTVANSQAKSGEGAIKFNKEGYVTIKTSLRLWSEKDAGTSSTVKYWYGKLHSDGKSYDKIDDSESTFTIEGGTKNRLCRMNTFTTYVNPNDRIVLRSLGDEEDGSFLECISDDKPLLDIEIVYDEVSAIDKDIINKINYPTEQTETLATNLIKEFGSDYLQYKGKLLFRLYKKFINSSTTMDIVFKDIPQNAFPHMVSIHKKDSGGNPIELTRTQSRYVVNTQTMNIMLGEQIDKDEELLIFIEVWV